MEFTYMLPTDTMPVDAEGYALPSWDVEYDELVELGYDDPSWGEPETWEPWTDAHTWELGPVIEAPPFAPSLADELDYREWAAEVDRRWSDERLEAGPITDEDVARVNCAG